MNYLEDDLWEYMKEEVQPMIKRLGLYDEESNEEADSAATCNIMLDEVAIEILKCISRLKIYEVRTII